MTLVLDGSLLLIYLFFAPSAVWHLAQSRNKQIFLPQNCSKTENKHQTTALTTARATPIPPAKIGVPPETEKPQNRAIGKSMGRQASPDKKPIKKVKLYRSNHTGTDQSKRRSLLLIDRKSIESRTRALFRQSRKYIAYSNTLRWTVVSTSWSCRN